MKQGFSAAREVGTEGTLGVSVIEEFPSECMKWTSVFGWTEGSLLFLRMVGCTTKEAGACPRRPPFAECRWNRVAWH